MSTKKHTVYVINTTDNGKSYWNRAGVAFGNRDGSFTFKLDVFPETKFQLREGDAMSWCQSSETTLRRPRESQLEVVERGMRRC